MGVYDTIWIPCPRCGTRYGAQTKSGSCGLFNYNLDEAPSDAMLDINRHAPFECRDCHCVFEVDMKVGHIDIAYRVVPS